MENNTQNNKSPQQIEQEVNCLKKRDRFLKTMLFSLLAVIFISLSVVYYFYSKYRKLYQSVEQVINSSENDIQIKKSIDEITENNELKVSSLSMENSSLSKITFSKEIMENISKSENINNVEEIVDEYYNDPAINSFIEKFKNDPEMKEIFQANPKERPLKMLNKMNDPVFMQKLTKEFLSNPELMKAMMKMGTDPRIQQMIRNSSQDKVLKVPVKNK